MKDYELLDAIGHIDPSIIEQTDTARKVAWQKSAVVAAACLLAVIAGAALLPALLRGNGGSQSDQLTEPGSTVSGSAAPVYEGVYIPKVTINIPTGTEAADMIAFFIYGGRLYSEYEQLPADSDVIGEHLGTSTGTIDEWSKPDDYIELSGSIGCDFYSVKGYDPAFMLCSRLSDGRIMLFVNDNDLTLARGSEVFEDRLHITDTLASVRYETNASWYEGKNEIYRLDDPRRSEAAEFIQAIDGGAWINYDYSRFSDKQRWVLYFDAENGLTSRVIVFDGGYVMFSGLRSVILEAEEEMLAPLLSLMGSHEGSTFVGGSDISGCSLEECRTDDYLGRYVPAYIPDGLVFDRAYKLYDIDGMTGAVGATAIIDLYFNSGGFCDISITDCVLTGRDPAIGTYDIDALTPEIIEGLLVTKAGNGQPLEYPYVIISVRRGNIVIDINARGLECRQVYEMIRSIG